jgi:aryl-alcohol dehydrogenase-like predicted oxidoreductase
MELRRVGNTGLRVSAVGIGCNNFGDRIDQPATERVVSAAIDSGITLFDTADTYGKRGGSETILGNILGPRRKQIVLATKFGRSMADDKTTRGASRRYIMQAVEASLKRLQTDWIDLYQLHFPDAETPIEETMRALDDLVRQGKVRYLGCSNFPGWMALEAVWTSRHHGLEHFVTVQNQYSLLWRHDVEPDLLTVASKYGLGILPYYPLAGGFLTGKYKRGTAMPAGARLSYVKRLQDRYVNDANWDTIDKLQAFATRHGHTLLDLAFAWLLAHPEVPSVIAGATKPEQIEANVKAGSWRLAPEQKIEVDNIVGGDLSAMED